MTVEISESARTQLTEILRQMRKVNPTAAQAMDDSFVERVTWLDRVRPKVQPWMVEEGEPIYRSGFSSTKRFERYLFFYIWRDDQMIVIACDYAERDPVDMRAAVASGHRLADEQL